MFQLIVSVIAIALVAILAAASIYYGGSAFTNSNAKGAAAALINSGEQIAGANTLYSVDHTSSAVAIGDLVTNNYLSALPTPPKFAAPAASWKLDAASTVAFIELDSAAATQVCTQVGLQGGASSATMTGTEPVAGDLTGVQFGCVGSNFAFKL